MTTLPPAVGRKRHTMNETSFVRILVATGCPGSSSTSSESRETRDRTAPPCLSRLDGMGGELHIPLTFPLQFFDPNAFEKALAVIRGGQIIYFHLSAVRRGVDKLVVTNVNANVSAISTLSKKNEIPLF